MVEIEHIDDAGTAAAAAAAAAAVADEHGISPAAGGGLVQGGVGATAQREGVRSKDVRKVSLIMQWRIMSRRTICNTDRTSGGNLCCRTGVQDQPVE